MECNAPIYAAGYYPLMHDRVDWDRDLKLMKECGIELVRTAELFNSWDRIEPEKGRFNFGFLDEFFDLCHKYDIKVLLGTGTASPPYWLHEIYPDVNILNNHNEQYPNNTSYSWACIDNPGYIKEAGRYLVTLVERYKCHPALYAYQIHNEISFPFMPLKEGEIDIYCYCRHSIEKFRIWVQNRYNSLDALNRAYLWGATNTCHASWEQVEPPRAKPASWSSITRWLDWRLFWMENIVEFVSWQNKLIKSIDNKHITTTNIFFLKSQDPLGVLTALDQFEMAKVVDVIGYDLYPGSGDKLEKSPEFSSMFLDMARSTSESLNKGYWMLETDSGPINGWVLGPSRNVKGFDLVRNVFEAFGHDAKLSLFQGWREWDFQPIHWGAIVDLDGRPTERTKAAENIGRLLKQQRNFLSGCKTNKAEIAILISKENAIILNGIGQDNFLLKALKGAYRVFWEKNYKIDFVTPELIMNGYANSYKAIYMPFMTHITKSLSQTLAGYTSQGGILVGTARCGMLGENGWYNHQIPCFDLKEVFGVEAVEVYANVNPGISCKLRNYSGFWHKEVLEIQKDTVKVLAYFHDDSPAVTVNSFGKGKAVYFATHPDTAYIEESSRILWDILDDVFAERGIRPFIEVDYTNRLVKEIDTHFLTEGNEAIIVITNYAGKNHGSFFTNNRKTLRVRLNTAQKYNKAIDLMTNENILFKNEEGFIYLEVVVVKNETRLIKFV